MENITLLLISYLILYFVLNVLKVAIPKSNFKLALYLGNLIFIVLISLVALNPELITNIYIIIASIILAIISLLYQYSNFKEKNHSRNTLIILIVNIVVLVYILTLIF